MHTTKTPTIPPTIPCETPSGVPQSTRFPVEASDADVRLALFGMPSLAMRAPRVPSFTQAELASVGSL